MRERIKRKEGDRCPKCAKPIVGDNVARAGSNRTQVTCASCRNEYMRTYMADRRTYGDQVLRTGLTIPEIKEREAKDPFWYSKFVAWSTASGLAQKERRYAKPERQAEIDAEWRGVTWENFTGGR